MGVTPEVLFSWTEGGFETMALAGTRSNDLNPEELLTDAKELHEHQIVVDDIKSRLKPFGDMSVDNTKLKKLKTLSHLETTMRLNLKLVQVEKMMEVLHPTAALGGWPREEANLLLQSFDSKKNREYFGAPFCFESLEKIFCVVMIRGLQWKSNKVLIRAGCGVVEQSKFENEFKEVCLKTKAIEEVFQIV
jgi:menaquinone-specific isochorismate synthase